MVAWMNKLMYGRINKGIECFVGGWTYGHMDLCVSV
jgi:hypothetical protein